MTNFAWANPTTGVRRQAATLEAARHELWEELRVTAQEFPAQTRQGDQCISATIYEQERAGSVSKAVYILVVEDPWMDGYAYASPVNGCRMIVGQWRTAVEDIQRHLAEMEDPPNEVIVYRQRATAVVCLGDLEPAPSPPPAPDTPSSLIQAVQDGTCYDLNRAQILAMLWIAEALQAFRDPPKTIYVPPLAVGPHDFSFSEGEKCSECGLPMGHGIHLTVPLVHADIDQDWAARPHTFFERPLSKGNDVCCICGHPEKHARHGYTGD